MRSPVNCDAEHAEAVAEVLARYAPGGVAIQQNALDLTGDEWRPDGPLEPVASVRAYLAVEPGLDEKRRQVEEALWHLRQIAPIPEPQFRTVAEEQWANAWKEHFHVTRIGARFVIKPSWRELPRPQDDDIVIELDPGMAFGTGLHPTTQMCLLALEKEFAARRPRARPGHRLRHPGDCGGQARRGGVPGARRGPRRRRSGARECERQRRTATWCKWSKVRWLCSHAQLSTLHREV